MYGASATIGFRPRRALWRDWALRRRPTNQATLVVWATRITLLDLAWGTFLTAVGATAGYLTSTLVKRN